MTMLPHLFRNCCAAFALLSALIYGLGLSGCASYEMGAPSALPFESVYIRPAGNDSFAPQAQALLSAELREVFIRDGRVRVLADETEADAVLEVNIVDYERSAAARRSDDTVVARDFDLDLTAVASLYNPNNGDFYFANREVRERTNAYSENPYLPGDLSDTQGFQQSEYQAMPRLARSLARRIADEVLSPWEPRAQH